MLQAARLDARAGTYDNVESARMPAKITSTLISGATFLATANTGLETTLLSAYGTNLNEIDPMTVRPPNPAVPFDRLRAARRPTCLGIKAPHSAAAAGGYHTLGCK